MIEAIRKEEMLLDLLGRQESVAVAFSGGVDSVYLAWAAEAAMRRRRELGLKGKALAITVCAQSFPARELEDARRFAEQIGLEHALLALDQFQVAGFAENPPDRCYHCKKAILSGIRKLAMEHDISFVMEGSNADDGKDYRPGARAVLEQNIKSPLAEVGLSKAEIRQLSKRAGLATWEKQSAACLASRFAYGEQITTEGLGMVEQAEDYLRDLGITGQMRVRIHGGNLARIEVAEDQLAKVLDGPMRQMMVEKMKEIGFSYVTLDLKGYRMGSMNEVLK